MLFESGFDGGPRILEFFVLGHTWFAVDHLRRVFYGGRRIVVVDDVRVFAFGAEFVFVGFFVVCL